MTEARASGRVIVIAGPACCGKSTVGRNLMGGGMPHVAEAIGLTLRSPCELIQAKNWHRFEESTCETVLFHYDFTRPPFREKRAGRDGALTVLARARGLRFLTLWAAPADVDRRFRRKTRSVVGGHINRFEIRLAWRAFREMRRKRPFVARRDLMWDSYLRWFEFTSTFGPCPHWILRSDRADDGPTPLTGTKPAPFWDALPSGSAI
jgi:hypothetical protein